MPSTDLAVLHKAVPDEHHHDASGHRVPDLFKEGVFQETLEFMDIVSNTARCAVPVERGQQYVSRPSQSTTGQAVPSCKKFSGSKDNPKALCLVLLPASTVLGPVHVSIR